MSVAGYITLGNISCNLCRDKVARQVAREIAQCNSAFREVAIIGILNLYLVLPKESLLQRGRKIMGKRKVGLKFFFP